MRKECVEGTSPRDGKRKKQCWGKAHKMSNILQSKKEAGATKKRAGSGIKEDMGTGSGKFEPTVSLPPGKAFTFHW